MNCKVSCDNTELRLNYLLIVRDCFQSLLLNSKSPRTTEAITLMMKYGLDHGDDIFESIQRPKHCRRRKQAEGSFYSRVQQTRKLLFDLPPMAPRLMWSPYTRNYIHTLDLLSSRNYIRTDCRNYGRTE